MTNHESSPAQEHLPEPSFSEGYKKARDNFIEAGGQLWNSLVLRAEELSGKPGWQPLGAHTPNDPNVKIAHSNPHFFEGSVREVLVVERDPEDIMQNREVSYLHFEQFDDGDIELVTGIRAKRGEAIETTSMLLPSKSSEPLQWVTLPDSAEDVEAVSYSPAYQRVIELDLDYGIRHDVQFEHIRRHMNPTLVEQYYEPPQN